MGGKGLLSEARNDTDLDHSQVRKYRAWYQHITLSMLAHTFLAVTALARRPEPGLQDRFPVPGAAR